MFARLIATELIELIHDRPVVAVVLTEMVQVCSLVMVEDCLVDYAVLLPTE